jgi:hypothetical protein
MTDTPFFLMMLREARADLRVALKSAPDEEYHELQRCIERLDDLVERCLSSQETER